MLLPRNSKRRAANRSVTRIREKSKRIEQFLKQAKFDLEMYSLYMNKSESELSFQKGIIRGLEIALKILINK